MKGDFTAGPRASRFPELEAELEAGTGLDRMMERLRPRYEALSALAQTGGVRERAPARRAMLAYERATELFAYLLATKAALHEEASRRR